MNKYNSEELLNKFKELAAPFEGISAEVDSALKSLHAALLDVDLPLPAPTILEADNRELLDPSLARPKQQIT